MTHLFKGSLPALVTPFKDGKVDEKAFRAHVNWVIEEGSHGIVPVGTTGESPTLTHDEHKRVVEWAVEEARGRVPVMAGAGSNNTVEAIEFSKHAEKVGAQGLLHVTPYYNKPSQEGLYQHFKAIAASTALPIFIYNIPPRSVVDMSVETMARLAEIKNIVGVKDATAKIDRVSAQRQACGKDFIQLSGEDGTALAHMAHGGHGCISVTANVAPRLCAQFQEACLAGDYAKALEIQDKLFPLHQALFVEPNPAPSKAALNILGRMSDEVRLPMVPASAATRATVTAALVHAGLMN
ncbi:4-hydroxy-tetrahydrodipicolinate synthase [Phreatobacter sp.]|uniref:4-hydroxy-tetrahydrodipicolinate synthase n=1 Tax=Phreatobacter sp. TaxID=1966341 RepID=UPI0022C15C5A|nr:4-hydroxy-tetrahydrodipicolinate synthase [Phreatobacter sp.]MCZ8315224.1 4-hydroxy-tetrahydrodipicolinate synthase [Phreatobacter sp.]